MSLVRYLDSRSANQEHFNNLKKTNLKLIEYFEIEFLVVTPT